MKLHFLLPAINGLILLGLLEVFLTAPAWFYWLGGLAVLINVLTAWLLTSSPRGSVWLNWLILPLVLDLASGAYLTILTSGNIKQLIIVAAVLLNFFYWRQVYLFLRQSNRYLVFSLENFSFYLSFYLLWLTGATLYAWKIFLDLSLWLIVPLAIGLTALVIYQLFWSGKLKWWLAWPFHLAMIILLAQQFLVISFLPFDYNILGFLWASNYYLLINLSSEKLADKLTRGKIKFYLIIAIISWIAVLLTGRWV